MTCAGASACEQGVSVDLFGSKDTQFDVMDRHEGEEEREELELGHETYNESANEILDPITAEIEVGIRVGELGKRESGLLLSNGTAGEVRLAESARDVGGVVEFDAFVEALDLVILDTGSGSLVSSENTRGSALTTHCLTLSMKSSLMPCAGILYTMA